LLQFDGKSPPFAQIAKGWGTLKFRGEVAFVEKREDGGEGTAGDGVSDAGGVGEA
jgi:hypothetical protein